MANQWINSIKKNGGALVSLRAVAIRLRTEHLTTSYHKAPFSSLSIHDRKEYIVTSSRHRHINHDDMMKLWHPRHYAVQQIYKELIKFRENDLQKFSYLCWIRVLDGNDY